MRNMVKTVSSTSAVVLLACASVASAVQVVDWSSRNYVTGDARAQRLLSPVNLTGVQNGFVPFDMTAPFNPSPTVADSVLYTPVAGKSFTYYGGTALVGPGNRALNVQPFRTGVRSDGLGDYILAEYAGAETVGFNGGDNTMAMAIVFKKEDFLAGSAGTVSLDSSSQFRLIAHVTNNGSTPKQRVIVQSNGNWAIGTSFAIDSLGASFDQSNAFGTLGFGQSIDSTGDYPLRKLNFSNIVWKQYDPASTIMMTDADFNAAAPYTGGFSDVTALGAYVQSSTPGGSLLQIRTALSLFQVSATVPEPTSLALLAGSAVLLLRRASRTRRD